MMNMWTNETLRAEDEYRRQQLHRLASHRSESAHRGGWHRLLPRGRRH